MFHAKPFCTKEIEEHLDRQLVIILVDLETTGVDITQDRIVELAALHVPNDPRFHGGSFSTIVRVDESILEQREKRASKLAAGGGTNTAGGGGEPKPGQVADEVDLS